MEEKNMNMNNLEEENLLEENNSTEREAAREEDILEERLTEEAVEEVMEEDITEEEEIEEEKDQIDLMADLVRNNSMGARLTNAEEFFEEPIALEVEEVLPSIDELQAREGNEDIRVLKGSKAIYLFSENYITNNYAKMLLLVEEKDLLRMVAETVREESKLYPRPTTSKLFSFSPFNLTKEQFLEVLAQLKTREEYQDIKDFKTSNGVLYLYSEKHLLRAKAVAYAEWEEVESYENP